MTPIFHFRPLVLALAALMLSACTTSVRVPAPVEDRSTSARPTSQPRATPPQVVSPAPTVSQGQDAPIKPGNENAGTPGYYTVQRGETLTSIARKFDCDLGDFAKANKLKAPKYAIRPGQALKLDGCGE